MLTFDSVLLFLAGMTGALVTVYMSRRTPIPPLRPFYDVEKDRVRRDERRTELDEIRADRRRLTMDPQPSDWQLRDSVLDKRHDDATEEIARLDARIFRHEIASRTLGMAIYIVLGGAVAALVVTYAPLDPNLLEAPRVLGALVVGSAWTSYLSVLGLRNVESAAEERLVALQKEYVKRLREMKELAATTTTLPVKTPDPAALGAGETPSDAASKRLAVLEAFGEAEDDMLEQREQATEALRRAVRSY